MRTYLPAIIVSILLFTGVLFSYQSARNRPGTIVLPGGITYLGPTPTPEETSAQLVDGNIPVSREAKWTQRNGTLFPYSFSYPETLSLGTFPNDPYDSLTVFYPGTDANANIFFRVENLAKLNKKQYVGKTMEYAGDWWKEYNWKGVASVSAFTNSKGLKGYRAKYLNDQNTTSYDHIFFEVPGRKDLIIWLSGKLFSQPDFDKLIDSVAWEN